MDAVESKAAAERPRDLSAEVSLTMDEQEEKYRVKVGDFEGPLDLLLYLIKREEIDIYNIPIARITEEYLEYIRLMRELNISLAGEFLVMAATLIYIKSRMLLPPDPAAERIEMEEDPRRELVEQLLEHQKFKSAAQMLYDREALALSIWSKPPKEVTEEGEEVISVGLYDLIAAFRQVVKRFEEQLVLEYVREEVTVEQRMQEIRRLLALRRSLSFDSLFAESRSRSHLIVTFLALLELVRLGEARLRQEKLFGEIMVEHRLN